MSLTLYPYVYLLARAAFVEQGSPHDDDAARTLGAGRTRGRSSGCCCRWPARRWPPGWRW